MMMVEARLTEPLVAAQIHAVALAAYALEAERIGCADFPPLHESLDDLRGSSDRCLVFQDGGRIVAALSFDDAAEPVVITRLVVRPTHLRRGIATALLGELERRLPAAARIAVTTAEANMPAVSLYRGLGYAPVGVSMAAEGISLVRFRLVRFRREV
jgi:ribosomal protein S18 acetylase RimI-like enzyme